jgi:hypothetical protein
MHAGYVNMSESGLCTIGHNEFDFFLKIKNTDPLMGAKFKSKTHLLYTFFIYFLRSFLRVWLKSSKKVLICVF